MVEYLNLEEIIAFLTLTYLSYTQVPRIARQCNVDLSLTERKKREEETDETDGTDGSAEEDTTGDSDSSRNARNGDTRSIPFGLVDDLFELSGAFGYGM